MNAELESLQRAVGYGPSRESVAMARRRFLGSIRRGSADGAGGSVLRALLSLREDDQGAGRRLADLIRQHDGKQLPTRLDELSRLGTQPRFASIEEAIEVRGYRQVHCVAVAAAVMNDCRQTSRRRDREYWRHAVATAVIGAVLAQGANSFRDEAFAAGLFHAIGSLATGRDHVPGETPEQDAAVALLESLHAPAWLLSLPGCGTEEDLLDAIVREACAEAAYLLPAGVPVVPAREASPYLRDLGGADWVASRIDIVFAAALRGVAAALRAA